MLGICNIYIIYLIGFASYAVDIDTTYIDTLSIIVPWLWMCARRRGAVPRMDGGTRGMSSSSWKTQESTLHSTLQHGVKHGVTSFKAAWKLNASHASRAVSCWGFLERKLESPIGNGLRALDGLSGTSQHVWNHNRMKALDSSINCKNRTCCSL